MGTTITAASYPREAAPFRKPQAAAGVAKLVGLDLVELSPPFDNGNISTLAALKVIFEFWGLASTSSALQKDRDDDEAKTSG